jgi:hypothetical protein
MKWWHSSGAAAKRARFRRARPAIVVAVEDETARARARVYWSLRGVEKTCGYCSESRVTLFVLCIERDDVFMFSCREHRARAAKDVAVGQYRALEGEDPYPAQLRSALARAPLMKKKLPAPASGPSRYDVARAFFAELDLHVKKTIVLQASTFRGLTLAEESPLFRQRFVALVENVRQRLAERNP